jgi:hypothetical protein
MFIIRDPDDISVVEETLDKAYNEYKELFGNYELNDLTFYEAQEIKVEQQIKIVEQSTITKRK